MSCHALISDATIIEAYSVDNISPEIKKSQCVDTKYPKDGPGGEWLEAKSVLLDIKKDDNSLLQNCCISNEYCKTHKNEKVVILNNIRLKEDKRKSGFGRKLHQKQVLTYKESGFSKMVLKAISDGVVVWNKLGFDFKQNTDKNRVLLELRRYLKDIKSVNTKYTDLKQVPKYLLFDDQKDFTEWLEERNISNISMLLELKDEQ